ncbi:MAG: hypothetical protein RLZZ367_223, partial [Bacteroidota bacterium]
LSTGAFAQQKYGHIDSDDILNSMPVFKQLNATLEFKRKKKKGKTFFFHAAQI